MLDSSLISSDIQGKWIEKFKAIKDTFKQRAAEEDIDSKFPSDNIKWLVEEGYSVLTLPKSYGGEGATTEDMVVLQPYLGTIDGATALSIGWRLSVVGQLYQRHMWSQTMLDQFAIEVKNGALVNKAVSEADIGSPTRGGRSATHAIKTKDGYKLNGIRMFISMNKALTYHIVAAFVEDVQEVGFFLIPRETKGLEIADNRNMLGMRATESHDLVLNDVTVPFENFVETKYKPQPNGWILHIPSVYLDIAQTVRDYATEFAKTHSPNSIEGTIATLSTVQQSIRKMESFLLSTRHSLWNTARGYNQYNETLNIWNETSAGKTLVMNQGLEVVDLAIRIIEAESLGIDRPLQYYYHNMRAGLHNPSIEDAAHTNIVKSIPDLM